MRLYIGLFFLFCFVFHSSSNTFLDIYILPLEDTAYPGLLGGVISDNTRGSGVMCLPLSPLLYSPRQQHAGFVTGCNAFKVLKQWCKKRQSYILRMQYSFCFKLTMSFFRMEGVKQSMGHRVVDSVPLGKTSVRTSGGWQVGFLAIAAAKFALLSGNLHSWSHVHFPSFPP